MAFTVTNLVDNSRDKYNGTGDTFFTDARIYEWLTNACNILARRAFLIEATSTTTSVSGTSDYAYPADTIAIKRVTYNGSKLSRITHREDDAVTLSGATSTSTGSSLFYTDYNFTISLRPIPDGAYTIKFYTYQDHPAISVGTTIQIPFQFQLGLVDHVLACMYAKDKDFAAAEYYDAKFEATVQQAIKYKQAQKRTDKFASVQSEELLPSNIIGAA